MPRIESFKGDVSKLTTSALLVDNLEEAFRVWGAVNKPFTETEKAYARTIAHNTNFHSLRIMVGSEEKSRWGYKSSFHISSQKLLGDNYLPTLMGLAWNVKILNGSIKPESIFGYGSELERILISMPLSVRALVNFCSINSTFASAYADRILNRPHKIPFFVQRAIAQSRGRNGEVETLVGFPDLNPKLMLMIADNQYGEEAKTLLALREDLPKQVIQKLLTDKSATVRSQMASRSKLPEASWEVLSKDKSGQVLKAVAQNPAAPEHLRVWAGLMSGIPTEPKVG